MDFDRVQAFLTLCEELHFGRTAERMYLSQPRISRLIASLESEIGATLFERTNRRVRLTPLGAELEARLRPAYTEMLAAVAAAQRSARAVAGTLRVAFTATTEGPRLAQLLKAFSRTQPGCEVTAVEVNMMTPYDSLRLGQADVLYGWIPAGEPDLCLGPVLERPGRVLAIARDDPLARQPTVSVGQFADRGFPLPQGISRGLLDAFYPPGTPLGDSLRRTYPVSGVSEVWQLVARGLVVHATAATMVPRLVRNDIVLVPITGLPPVSVGLIWHRPHHNARIRALVGVARTLASEGA